MVSRETIEEYYQLREVLRPFLEQNIGLVSCNVQQSIEAMEQLLDFEEHLQNDPVFANTCADTIYVAKCMLAKHIAANDGKRYLSDEDIAHVEEKLGTSLSYLKHE